MVAKKTTGRVTAKKATEDLEVTSIVEWKKESKGSPLRVPSGKVVIAKNPGMQAFLKTGIIPNSLMNIVTEALNQGKKPDFKVEDIDNKKLEDMLRMADSICVAVILEPKVLDNVNSEGNVIPLDQRDEEALYIDELEVDDKMFIFQFAVGGTRDLETFRKEQAKALGNV